MERISLDTNYIDNLIFKLNHTQLGNRSGLELTQSYSKYSSQIFQNALQKFLKELAQRKGIEKNLFARKFIKEIIYSKETIQINLYYSELPDEQNALSGVGRWRAGDRRIVAGTCEPTRVGLEKNDFSWKFKEFEPLELAPREDQESELFP